MDISNGISICVLSIAWVYIKQLCDFKFNILNINEKN